MIIDVNIFYDNREFYAEVELAHTIEEITCTSEFWGMPVSEDVSDINFTEENIKKVEEYIDEEWIKTHISRDIEMEIIETAKDIYIQRYVE